MSTTVTLTNIMANKNIGFFPAFLGNCSWQMSTLVPGDGSTNSAKVIPSAQGEVTLTSSDHGLIASHKYYVTFKIRFESATQGTCDWYWPVAEPAAASGMAVNAAAGAWTRLSATFDRTSFADGNYPCRFDYNNNDGSNRTFWFTSCLLVDLTAAFGAGKEPSKDWLDKHVTAFSDAPSVQYVENLGELFTNIADAIRAKSGQTGEIFACDFADRIRAL